MKTPSATSPRIKAAPETRDTTGSKAARSTQASLGSRSVDRAPGVVENLQPVQGEISPLAARILNKMGSGLREAPRGGEPDFDLEALNEAVKVFSEIDANTADDDRFMKIKALFSVSTLGETTPFEAIRILVTDLNQLSSFDEDLTPHAIEAAYNTLFANDPAYPDGTQGQLLVSSISDVVSSRTEITKNLESLRPHFEVLNNFLKALQAI